MDAACVLCFTQEGRDSGNEEENEASETILGEGMQVYTEQDEHILSSHGLGCIEVAALGTKGITHVHTIRLLSCGHLIQLI